MAKMLILRLDQEIHFKSELNCLKVKRELSKTSKLFNLSPFFEKNYEVSNTRFKNIGFSIPTYTQIS